MFDQYRVILIENYFLHVDENFQIKDRLQPVWAGPSAIQMTHNSANWLIQDSQEVLGRNL